MLKRVIYASIENRPFSPEELAELAELSGAKNQADGITGYLFYRYGVFFQFLEGEVASLDNTLSAIGRDSRHSIIRQFLLAPSEEREFPGWDMQLFDMSLQSSTEVDGKLESLILRLRDKPLLEEAEEKEVVDLLQRIVRKKHLG